LSAQFNSPYRVDYLSLWRSLALMSATLLAPYQLYFLPMAGTFFPLALFFTLACLPFIKLRLFDKPLTLVGGAYFFLAFCSVAWSPDKGSWATSILYGFWMYVAFFTARTFDDPAPLRSILHWFLMIASINAFLVVLFRVATGVKEAYLASPLMGVFKNPKLVANLEVFRPNVFDPDKSGGVFDNANTGAAFSLLCVGVTLATFGYRGRTRSLIFFVLFSLAVVFSGSKSAVMIYIAAMTILGFCAALFSISNAYLRVVALSFGTVAALAMSGLAVIVESSLESTDFGEGVRDTSESRFQLWRIARLTFMQHPIRGLGFGGWGEVLSNYAATGVNVFLPPHNSLIMAWTECGIFAVILCVSFWYLIARRLFRSIGSSPRSLEPIGALFALFCVAAMSFGDTFPLYGNQTMTVPMGVLLALGIFHDRADPSNATGPLPNAAATSS
jgi:O-antigen ligase